MGQGFPQGTPQNPEVIMPGAQGTVPQPVTTWGPSFPVVAYHVDNFARRVPWWIWVGLGLLVGSGFAGGVVKRMMKAASAATA